MLGGRGSGKTRLGAEWVHALACGAPPFSERLDRYVQFALVGETLGDVREVMIDGPSGIRTIARKTPPRYEATRRRLVWESGAMAQVFSSEDPESLRGPQFEAAWCDELGCPAVDKGANQPNVFTDARSSESAVPHFSNGARSDLMQKRFIEAHFEHWSADSPHFEPANNPVSDVYGERMVDPAHICVWAWDARPYPAFPRLTNVWSDGTNWHRGHWLNGRIGTVATEDLVRAILTDHGFANVEVDALPWTVGGLVVETPSTARAALEPLVDLMGLNVFDEAGTIIVRSGARADATVMLDALASDGERPDVERIRAADHELPGETELRFVDGSRDYQSGLARAVIAEATGSGLQTLTMPAVLDADAANALLVDRARRGQAGRETMSFRLPASSRLPRPGDFVNLPDDIAQGDHVVTQVEGGTTCRITTRSHARRVPAAWRSRISTPFSSASPIGGAPHVDFLDLPMLPGETVPTDQFKVAVFARPWRTHSIFASPEDTGFAFSGTATRSTTMGELVEPLAAGTAGLIQRAGGVVARLHGGEFASVSQARLLNGANLCAVRASNGAWELLQFQDAEEIEPSVWLLKQLLRGQLGTEDAMHAGAETGAAFVLVDGALARTGLAAELAGLPLNWRIGPAGGDFGGADFVAVTAAGGTRSQLPLSPVHLTANRIVDGDIVIEWIRRGRLDADSWQGEEIPLGEEFERYRVELADDGGNVVRTIETSTSSALYAAADILADFEGLPSTVTITVRQLSAAVGAGLPATIELTIP